MEPYIFAAPSFGPPVFIDSLCEFFPQSVEVLQHFAGAQAILHQRIQRRPQCGSQFGIHLFYKMCPGFIHRRMSIFFVKACRVNDVEAVADRTTDASIDIYARTLVFSKYRQEIAVIPAKSPHS